MPKLRVLRSASRNVYENLALEEYLFRRLEADERALLLWRNRDSVVIGRYQNPYIECSLQNMERNGVSLARRQSGGGTVWHDEGTLCFTFFGPRQGFDRRENIEITLRALKNLGVPAEVNERLDILVEDKKISGSAFRESGGFSFHHGTILIRADLERLSACLAGPAADTAEPGPDPAIPAGGDQGTGPEGGDFPLPVKWGGFKNIRGIRSVRSPVANVQPYLPPDAVEAVETALAESFVRAHDPAAPPDIRTVDFRNPGETAFTSYLNYIRSRDWLFKASPAFSRAGVLGGRPFHIDVRGGIIVKAAFEPDETGPPAGAEDMLNKMFTGRDYGAIFSRFSAGIGSAKSGCPQSPGSS
jgi:lipoate-protein ligase A